MLDNASSNQPSKFKTKNWIEINDESRGTYNVNSQIKFRTTMLKSSLCDHSDAYILVNGTITVNNTAAAPAAAANNTGRKVWIQKSGFKRVINWNKYLSKPEFVAPNPNLNHLVEPSFQGINRLFVLAFENDDQKTSAKGYYLPNVEMKNYNIMINGENFIDQPIKSNKVTYENIRKIAIGQGVDYTAGCLLDYPYFKDIYKMITVDLSEAKSIRY